MFIHPISPVYDADSEVLILGSFPSVKSREAQFFYGHPQNRFWKLLGAIFDKPVPHTTNEKRQFLIAHRIALWDVIASCDITGSSDASITNVTPNDITPILNTAPIRAVFCNGAKAYDLYNAHILPVSGRTAVKLPSTSPANAVWSLERLKSAWQDAFQACGFLPR